MGAPSMDSYTLARRTGVWTNDRCDGVGKKKVVLYIIRRYVNTEVCPSRSEPLHMGLEAVRAPKPVWPSHCGAPVPVRSVSSTFRRFLRSGDAALVLPLQSPDVGPDADCCGVFLCDRQLFCYYYGLVA